MTPTVKNLSDLVQFQSVSGKPNDDIMSWLETFLCGIGANVVRIDGDRSDATSLFATIGPHVKDGLLLSAHSDVVPVTGQNWSSDPFVLTEHDGKLYGRGATDMKGFLACMLSLAQKATHLKLKRPLHLAISYDEELGCLGVHSLLRTLKDSGIQIGGCIVGEPTQMQVGTTHKGKVAFKIICHGAAAHSSNPFKGVNAIAMAADMIRELADLQEHMRREHSPDTRFTVPFSTVQVGLVEGGSALNIVPEFCTLTAEMRLVPKQDGAAYLAWLQAACNRVAERFAGGTLTLEVMNGYPGLNSLPDTPFCTAVLHAAGQNGTCALDFGTEAGLFAKELAIPCLVCGPGSIEQAHKADEYIKLSELERCEAFLDKMLQTVCL